MVTPELTVWELFFMLLTMIPVSRMMHSIFMRLIVRIGTVDEEKWGTIALGSLGSMIGGALTLGKVAVNSLGSRGTPLKNFTGPSGGAEGVSLGSVTGSSVNGITERAVKTGPPPLVNAITAAGSNTGGATVGAALGEMASFATPQIRDAFSTIGAAMGKIVGMPLATTYNIGKELVNRTDYGKNRELYESKLEALKMSGGFSNLLKQSWDSAKEVTGAKTTVGALGVMAGAVIASPLGQTASRYAANTMRFMGDFRPRDVVNTIDNLRGIWRS